MSDTNKRKPDEKDNHEHEKTLSEIYEERKGLVKSFEHPGMINTNEGNTVSPELFDRNMRNIKTGFITKAI